MLDVKRIAGLGVAVLVLSTVLAMLALHFLARPRSDEEAARALLATGRAAEAEELDARVLEREPTVPRVLALAHAHVRARVAQMLYEVKPDHQKAPPKPPMSDEALEAIFQSLPLDVARVGRFATGSEAHPTAEWEDARDELQAAAERDPPMPWANHVLAGAARDSGDELRAATLFWREGSTFPERRQDLDEALASWIDVGAWEEAHERAAAAGVAQSLSPRTRYELAVHDGDWRAAARALPGLWRPRFDVRLVWLAAVAALAWGFFCARLGKLVERPRLRAPLYLVSFALGVLSVVPTALLIAVEEAKLKLVETGTVARDLLFFVFGVGLREEASKLLLFLPLLPVLRRWGDKLDVLVCGAMVGLGFAAEENLGYLAGGDLHTGLGRFLTANFLHMAMTGILASALDDFLRDREKHAADFTRTSLLVVGLHGAYDFLLSHEEMGGSYFAMGVFVLLAKLFLDTVDAARRRADRGVTPMMAFILALAVVTGTSLAYAIHAVGPVQGPMVMAEGLLGEAILVIVFARVLSAM